MDWKMKFKFCQLLVAMVVLWGVQSTQAAEDIKVPFGFQWGENSQRLEQMLVQSKAKITERKQVDNRQAITAEGITQRLLRQAVFYFDNDSLNEIELRYGDENWDTSQYTNFFEQTRLHIEEKYGPGRLIARTTTRQGDMVSSILGYQWTQTATTLQLFLFTAEQSGDAVRVLSLHYRGY